jgi:hypothetical protein
MMLGASLGCKAYALTVEGETSKHSSLDFIVIVTLDYTTITSFLS